MPSDRQRAKRRQAERRAERLARGGGARVDREREAEAVEAEEFEREIDFSVGAPPEDTGRSDTVTAHPPPPPDTHTGAIDDGDAAANGDHLAAGRTRRGHETHARGRLVAFLVAVWAELGRVQWPNRQQLTQLTGVVLFFVIIVGAYLGALDAVFSKLVQAIL